DVGHWVRSFLGSLETASGGSEHAATLPPPATPPAVVEQLRAATNLLLLLDYEGTLVPHASVPELATPDEALLELLRTLAARTRPRGQRAITREPGPLARPAPDRPPCRPWLLVAAGERRALGAATVAADGVARAGARHPRAGGGQDARISRRAKDRLAGLALPDGGPGVR